MRNSAEGEHGRATDKKRGTYKVAVSQEAKNLKGFVAMTMALGACAANSTKNNLEAEGDFTWWLVITMVMLLAVVLRGVVPFVDGARTTAQDMEESET